MNGNKLMVGLLVAMLMAGLIVMVSPKMMADGAPIRSTVHYSSSYMNTD